MKPELKEWIWLANLQGLITRKKVELLRIFDSPVQLYNADAFALAQTGILSRENINAILSPAARVETDRTMEILGQQHIDVITLNDESYPHLLKSICDPPVCLYVRGKIFNEEPCVGVVGSRKASGYGLSAAKRISCELSQFHICVVSGMARGIDTAAHLGALQAGGRTIAVFGCGLDIVYPPENKKLMERIAEKGALVSEYPPGVLPAPHHFPIRNRIVSGLSVGILVVEAGEKSGSLITAQLALEQGRDVYALPGNVISLNSKGTNKLIQDGAKLVTSVQDILEEVVWFKSLEEKPVLDLDNYRNRKALQDTLDTDEQNVMEMLSIEALQIDEIQSKLACELPLVHRVLLSLEMKGLIKREAGGKYSMEV
ncbi:MAG: DNA-processing protein DprA [Thermoclostridium sp.]|nr:DNA-processing protein DprA [Thermoclostridium sp.]